MIRVPRGPRDSIMKVSAYYPADGNKLVCPVVRAFAEGAPNCGVFVDTSAYIKCDVLVIFGWVKYVYKKSYEKQRLMDAHNGPVIVLERGYLDRENYFAAGFGGINGRADFRNYNVPRNRWDRLCLELKPWIKGGDYVLVCGQIAHDVAVQDSNHLDWCRETVKTIRKMGYDVRFRPHPLMIRQAKKGRGFAYDVNCEQTTGSLERDFAGAMAVVTQSSNTGVEAVIAGIPTIACDQSMTMTRGVSGRSLLDLADPVKSDREKWAHRLSYAQWTREEFRSGLAWRHLSGDMGDA